MRPDVFRPFEVASLKGGPNALPGTSTIGGGSARYAHMVHYVREVLLRPPAILLRAPEPVLARDDTATGDVRELRDVTRVWRRDHRAEPTKVQGDACVQRSEVGGT